MAAPCVDSTLTCGGDMRAMDGASRPGPSEDHPRIIGGLDRALRVQGCLPAPVECETTLAGVSPSCHREEDAPMLDGPLPLGSPDPRGLPIVGAGPEVSDEAALTLDVPPSSWAHLDGPVHYLDYGGPADGPLMVLVHGLGGSALNWAAVAPALARRCRVLAIDLAGFGRTRSGGRSVSVPSNQRLLHRFLTEVTGSPAILVGNSMGGLITVLQAHEHPDTVAAAVLVDPALPVGPTAWPDPLVGMAFTAYAVPAVGRRLLSGSRRLRSADANATAILRLCCADASRVPQVVVGHHLGLARERHADPDVDAELLVAARSLMWVLARRGRHAAMM